MVRSQYVAAAAALAAVSLASVDAFVTPGGSFINAVRSCSATAAKTGVQSRRYA